MINEIIFDTVAFNELCRDVVLIHSNESEEVFILAIECESFMTFFFLPSKTYPIYYSKEITINSRHDYLSVKHKTALRFLYLDSYMSLSTLQIHNYEMKVELLC